MVFSYIKNFILSFFYSNDGEQQTDDPNDQNEAELLRKITEEEDDIPVQQVPSTNSVPNIKSPDNEESIKCFRKTGKVTFLNCEYGLIDNEFYFNPNQVLESANINVNDEVAYLAYRATENQAERIFKVMSISENMWDSNADKKEVEIAVNVPQSSNVLQQDIEVQTLNRILNGKVVSRKDRELFIEPPGIWCNLDDVEIDTTTTFVPIVGDWVSLGAKVTIDEEVTDLTGEIVEVKSIKPLRVKYNPGRVTLWNMIKKGEGEGAIEREIYFNQEFCEHGYIPSLGDEVWYEAIESDQDDYHWRAISVIPIDVQQTAPGDSNSAAELKELLKDKNKISVVGLTDFGEVRINETKELILEVKNFGRAPQMLLRSRFHTQRKNSQITLVSPGLNDQILVNPDSSVQFKFECKGKFVGYNSELFVFTFRGFRIGRNLEMNILVEKDLNHLLPTDLTTHYKKSFHSQRTNLMKSLDRNGDSRTYGAKPKSAPKFIKGERPGRYKIPEKLWGIMLGNSGLPKSKEKLEVDIQNAYGYLKGELQPANYADWFHLLLYMEETNIRLELRRFDMNSVIMRRHGDHLVLEVPGLQEQRPSLIIGDRVIANQPYVEIDNKEHVGFIHEIRQKEVFVKFHPSFHDSYDESDCNVYFEVSMSNLQRAHDAINRAMRKLGSKWLFPSSVQEKPVQIFFEEIEDFSDLKKAREELTTEAEMENGPADNELNLENILREQKKVETEYDVDENGFLIPRKETTSKIVKTKSKADAPEEKKTALKKRKLIWFNKSLNYHQKASIVNVLRGQGRPLPYVIFGPPGTGKTITLVETILQIYTLLPESRLLVGTPSNSSADLLCERIVDSGVLKPGELVRIMAFHRACDGNIPEKLIPYCTTTDLRDDKGDSDMFVQPENRLKQSSLSQLIGRHRITVGTCSALGSMHYMGFPPDHFTHIIVDEAGQALEPEILIPISFLNPQKGQVILAGDPEQLGPICLSKVADENGLGRSLLQRFVQYFPYQRDHVSFPNTNGYDPRFITRLCINYRSIPEILDLPSQLFYNSELVPTVSPSDSFEFDLCRKFEEISKIRDPPASIIFHGVRGQNHQDGDCPSWYNPQEIWQCITYLKKCYSIGLTADQCGIITPYKKQVQKLRQLLTELETPVPKIGTVEDFQGQERHVIILSAVRSSLTHIGTDIKHSLGFVASPRRLNVALTRARAILVIVGNPHLLSMDPYWRSALIYCVNNNSYLGCDLPNNV